MMARIWGIISAGSASVKGCIRLHPVAIAGRHALRAVRSPDPSDQFGRCEYPAAEYQQLAPDELTTTKPDAKPWFVAQPDSNLSSGLKRACRAEPRGYDVTDNSTAIP
jgi:hypothetical protein